MSTPSERTEHVSRLEQVAHPSKRAFGEIIWRVLEMGALTLPNQLTPRTRKRFFDFMHLVGICIGCERCSVEFTKRIEHTNLSELHTRGDVLKWIFDAQRAVRERSGRCTESHADHYQKLAALGTSLPERETDGKVRTIVTSPPFNESVPLSESHMQIREPARSVSGPFFWAFFYLMSLMAPDELSESERQTYGDMFQATARYMPGKASREAALNMFKRNPVTNAATRGALLLYFNERRNDINRKLGKPTSSVEQFVEYLERLAKGDTDVQRAAAWMMNCANRAKNTMDPLTSAFKSTHRKPFSRGAAKTDERSVMKKKTPTWLIVTLSILAALVLTALIACVVVLLRPKPETKD